MKVKEIPRIVYDRVYVAQDGREFKTMEECEAYEISIDDILKRKKEVEKAVKKLEIKEIFDHCWIRTDRCFISDNSAFAWYKLNNEDDLELLEEYFDEAIYIGRQINYPDIVCIEQWDDGYNYAFVSDMIEEVKDYFKDLGYKVMIEKE